MITIQTKRFQGEFDTIIFTPSIKTEEDCNTYGALQNGTQAISILCLFEYIYDCLGNNDPSAQVSFM